MKHDGRCRHCGRAYKVRETLPWSHRGFCSTECFFGSRGEAHVAFPGPSGELIRQSVIRYQAQTGRDNIQYVSVLGLLFPADDLPSNYDFLVVLIGAAKTPEAALSAMEVVSTCLNNWCPSCMDPEDLSRARQIRMPHARAVALKGQSLLALEHQDDPKIAPYRLTLEHAIRSMTLPESMNTLVPADAAAKVPQAN